MRAVSITSTSVAVISCARNIVAAEEIRNVFRPFLQFFGVM